MNVLLVWSAVITGGVFGLAALAKAAEVANCRGALRAFDVPEAMRPAVAVAIPLLELCVPVLLLSHSTRLLGFLLAAGLLATFSVALLRVLRRRAAASCVCFGPGSAGPVRPVHVTRNLVLLAVALVGAGAELVQPAGTMLAHLALGITLALPVVVVARFPVGVQRVLAPALPRRS